MANLPPTPAPSTDIAGKPTALSAQLDSIALPPAAINGRASVSSSSTNDNASDSSYRPMSPSSPHARQKAPLEKKLDSGASSASRRRWSDRAADNYALPPPPTRNRKIIQMKPQSAKGKGDGMATSQQSQDLSASQTSSKGPAASPPQHAQGQPQVQAAAGGKKKQANTSTAAGRKIARKTAHSLIERRRRSKMNEEFGVLKDMIPACAGQEMHKLAILQASIEYMRYLESCVSELKAAHKNCKTGDAAIMTRNAPSYDVSTARTSPTGVEDDEEDEDEEMADDDDGAADTAPASAANTPLEHPLDRRYTNSTAGHSRPSVSPAILPSATTSPLFTRPSMSSNQSFSNLPSPAFYAQQQSRQQARLPSLSLASPMLAAQRGGAQPDNRQLPPLANQRQEQTHSPASQSLPAVQLAENDEATASALLMLTADKRSWTGRGMSVKDLLSSQ